jgi:Uma2 family endonuclease
VPDLAAWRRERMPRDQGAAFYTEAPDWICEVVSPSTERLDRSRKIAVYAGEKVG